MTVLTVDDQAIFPLTVRRLLAAANGFQQVGEAASGARAIELAATLQPDLVLVDVRMAEMDGIETAPHMHALIPEAVIVLISVGEIPDAARLAPAVAACLRKQELSVRTLRRCRRRVFRGALVRTPIATGCALPNTPRAVGG